MPRQDFPYGPSCWARQSVLLLLCQSEKEEETISTCHSRQTFEFNTAAPKWQIIDWWHTAL